MSTSTQVDLADTDFGLTFTVTQDGIGGVTGETPTVAIRRAESTTLYLDFADNTFKSAAWTTKYAPLAEVERGHYQRNFDASAVTLTAGDVLVAEYWIDDGGSVVADAHDLLIMVAALPGVPPTPAAIADAVWDEPLSGHITAGTTGAALAVVLGVAGKTNIRWDNAVYSPATGFLASIRLRVFASAGAASAATPGAADGADGEIFRIDHTANPDGTFATLPADILNLLT